MSLKNECPICGQNYKPTNTKTKHHIFPRRFFGETGVWFYLCRACHNKLEEFIPKRTKLEREEYLDILKAFTHYKAPMI